MRRAGTIVSMVLIGAVLIACSRSDAPGEGQTYVGSADGDALESFREDFIAIADTSGWAVTDSSALPGEGTLRVFGMKDCLIAIADGSASAGLIGFDFHDKCAGGERTDEVPSEFRPLIEEYGLEGSSDEPPFSHME